MSDFLMLLIVLSQKISGSFDQIIVILTDQYNRVVGLDQQWNHHEQVLERSMDVAQEIDHNEEMLTVRKYVVDLEEEPCVFGGVIILQLRKMIMLLESLRVMLREARKSSHITMLDSVIVKAREQLRLCTSGTHAKE